MQAKPQIRPLLPSTSSSRYSRGLMPRSTPHQARSVCPPDRQAQLDEPLERDVAVGEWKSPDLSTPFSPRCWLSRVGHPFGIEATGPDGQPCGRGTAGLLQRRPVKVGRIVLIGKESNRIEERSSGELTADDVVELVTTYDDHDEWYRLQVPRLGSLDLGVLVAATGVSPRRVRDWIVGRSLPHQRHRESLRALVGDD